MSARDQCRETVPRGRTGAAGHSGLPPHLYIPRGDGFSIHRWGLPDRAAWGGGANDQPGKTLDCTNPSKHPPNNLTANNSGFMANFQRIGFSVGLHCG